MDPACRACHSVSIHICNSHSSLWNKLFIFTVNLFILTSYFSCCSFSLYFTCLSLILCFQEIIRTVLGNLDSLQPFSSSNFNVFPCILHSNYISLFIHISVHPVIPSSLFHTPHLFPSSHFQPYSTYTTVLTHHTFVSCPLSHPSGHNISLEYLRITIKLNTDQIIQLLIRYLQVY